MNGKNSIGQISWEKLIDPVWQPIIESIKPMDTQLLPQARGKMDNKTKPLGSLGRLEDLAIQLCLIQNNLNPKINRKQVLVFAGDHGVVEEGVSAYPAEVTAQMIKNFLNGGAAINVLCRHHGIDMRVVDMGVNADFEDHPLLVKKKVRKGTRNFALESAMTPQETVEAVQNGMDVFLTEHANRPIDIVGLGDMGIGNTTAAAAIICAVTGISPIHATGRGTGIDDKTLERKVQVIEKALQFHNPDPLKGFDVLQKAGGYEIAGIAGAVLAAASRRVAVVLDGVISTAGGLIAYLINPDIRGYLISGHRSVEPAHQAALSYMDLEPVIDLNMRLGEGTGAAIAINIVEAVAKIMCEMASFDEAGVSKKNET
ncbi:MAG: nicotinate-nucleotide--dimethylbenzimidazole phosphoribosyltransferase [Deltaproteobacteria bacterium]|nr:nicotinate-nucleotide--dimethylbenzimidazole phosphoribosyltransferase [Deltaproteobacteria bacterium]MBW1929975.1 nicotinate-nucleotide--dimethylbenzimidazole phosphoribosyltransferase [Deltaproteobacteria bacterium]MBW2026070.1 nicotinate-nucleotide--dimethylbenzimidazole phosphoribosyltransferase [Deltaproteobacteria bacterium]